ncbi:MAG: hypothetical protein LBD09_06965, partial [Treponema sp.]|nr:hypothetical protein [Treponema sp.]
WTEGQTLGLLEKIDSRGRIHVDQGIIAGCAGGTFDNIMAVSDMLNGGSGDPVAGSGPAFSGDPAAGSGPAFSGDPAAGSGPENEDPAASGFSLSVYPGSQPVYLELARNGALARLAAAGVVIKTAFCGPCFGAGDVPAHRSLSIRHTTRNFPNREGSRPKDGQIASAALMDARSVAATARNGGILASAEEYTETGIAASTGAGAAGGLYRGYPYRFDDAPYRARVYNGFGGAGTGELRYGPNITGWPDLEALGENLLIKIVSFITDPVTTTDELIPSGETSSYRSNPLALAEFTLSRKDPAYVGKAKALRTATAALRTASAALRTAPAALRTAPAAPRGGGGGAEKPETAGTAAEPREAAAELGAVLSVLGETAGAVQIVSAIFAVKPGDGSAREQAASCQRVLGGGANFANEYATKRYRSNLVNWGMIPFIIEGKPPFQNGDYVYVPGAGALVRGERRSVEARIVRPRRDDPAPPGGAAKPDGPANGAAEIAGTFTLAAPELNDTERELLLAGSLINYNRNYNRARLESAGTGAPGGTA